MKEGLVLIHGILSNKYLMHGIAKHLKKHNFDVLNINNPSFKHGILAITDLIHTHILNSNNQLPKIHFIGHSMGGLIIKAYRVPLCKRTLS